MKDSGMHSENMLGSKREVLKRLVAQEAEANSDFRSGQRFIERYILVWRVFIGVLMFDVLRLMYFHYSTRREYSSFDEVFVCIAFLGLVLLMGVVGPVFRKKEAGIFGAVACVAVGLNFFSKLPEHSQIVYFIVFIVALFSLLLLFLPDVQSFRERYRELYDEAHQKNSG